MGPYKLGAYPANRRNHCFCDGAGIWRLMGTLESAGFDHSYDASDFRDGKKYFFECYPNLALVGLLGGRLPRYKLRHRDRRGWACVLELIRGLEDFNELAIDDAKSMVPADLDHTKNNEDRIDALIAAYTAAWHHRFKGQRSVVVGEMATGYMVAPVAGAHGDTIRTLLAEAWSWLTRT
jgi:predicted RNase H-like nuclease